MYLSLFLNVYILTCPVNFFAVTKAQHWNFSIPLLYRDKDVRRECETQTMGERWRGNWIELTS